MSRAATLRMPRLGETMESGRLVSWLVEPGTPFRRGDPILEVETDKTVVELPALGPGTVTETLAEIGETVSVGAAIAKVDIAEGPDWTADGEDHPPETAAPETKSAGGGQGGAEDTAGDGAPMAAAAPAPGRMPGARPRATPLARRIARRARIDLSGVTGTGRRGRIERADVEAALAAAGGGLGSLQGIAYRARGPENGSPVLFLHGFAADHGAWAALAGQLSRAGRRTVAADLPGHGATTLGAESADDLSAAMLAFAGGMFAGEAVDVVAHSLGAVPATALAAEGRAKTLTLIAPTGLGHAIDADFVRGLAEARGPGEVGHLLSRMTDGPTGLSEAAIAELAERLGKGRLRALAAAILGASGQAIDLRGTLAGVAARIPVRLILGHRDRIVDWRESVAISPRIAVHHLPRCGHMPHWEALAEVGAILKALTEKT